MTDSAKIMAAGCAAGAAAAVIPTVYGIVKTFSRPLEERDRLTAQGDGFVTAAGKQVFLRGINLADALPELLAELSEEQPTIPAKHRQPTHAARRMVTSFFIEFFMMVDPLSTFVSVRTLYL